MSASVIFTSGDSSGYKNGLIIGLVKVANKIKNQAKGLTPVDTGLLRSSIDSGEVDSFTAYVGTDTEYAPDVEFGTKTKAAQPFLRPAVYVVNNPGTGKMVADALNIGMRKTLKNKKTRKL